MHTMMMGLFEKFGQKNLFSLASRKLATFFTHFEDRWKVTNWPKKLIPIVLSSNFNSPFFFFLLGIFHHKTIHKRQLVEKSRFVFFIWMASVCTLAVGFGLCIPVCWCCLRPSLVEILFIIICVHWK